MRLPRLLASIGIALAAPAGAAAGEPPEAPLLRVDVAIDGGTPIARLMAAEADAIWRRHGVAIALAAPGETGPGGILLTVALEPVGRAPGRTEGLGSIWFLPDGRPGTAIRLDQAAVRARVRQSGASARPLDGWPGGLAEAIVARALGRVLAHEIGHFLLASPAHAPRGLMRAAFDGRRLAEWSRRSFELDPIALPRLRARLARLRAEEAPLVVTRQ